MSAAGTSGSTLLETLQRSASVQLHWFAAKLPNLITALIVVLVTWLVARAVRGAVRRVMAKTSTEGHVDFVVARLSYAAVWVVGAIVALGIMGVSVAALVASLGVVTIAVGFAMKDVLGNLVAGISILFQRPFTIGDAVKIDAVEGTVTDIRLRDTVLRSADGTLIFLPNEKVYTAVITNVSAPAKRRGEVTLAVEFAADLSESVREAMEALTKSDAALDDPPPEVLVTALADGAVKLSCRFWVDASAQPFAAAKSEVAAALKAAMDDAGVALK